MLNLLTTVIAIIGIYHCFPLLFSIIKLLSKKFTFFIKDIIK